MSRLAMYRLARILLTSIAALMTSLAIPADAAQSFVYVTRTHCSELTAPLCPVAAVDAYDATTGALAASIPLLTFSDPMTVSRDGSRIFHASGKAIRGYDTTTFALVVTIPAIPFGNIDTPSAGQTVSGTIINLGWALTPQPAFIPGGSTIDVLVDGLVIGHPTYGFARSDIDTFFPGHMNSGAADGYFILDTTSLTNGVHTIAWIVQDSGNRIQGIGNRFFTVANP